MTRWSELLRHYTPEWADEVERCLVPLLDPKDLAVLHPQLAPNHEAAVRMAERLPWLEAFAVLKGRLRRDDPEGDVPYARVLADLEEPLPFARAWWDHMCEAHLTLQPMSVIVFAVAAYAVSVSYALLGNHGEARRWAKVGAETTEFEPRVGLSLVVYVRAVKLLSPLLRKV